MPSKIATYCPAHLPTNRETTAAYESQESRRDDKRFYARARWRAFRAAFLRDHPLCCECLKSGRYEPAEHVHHVTARKADPDAAYEESNCRGLCEPCHSSLEARRRAEMHNNG
jgi:5-methylcytosine-specific restriction enzyme A